MREKDTHQARVTEAHDRKKLTELALYFSLNRIGAACMLPLFILNSFFRFSLLFLRPYENAGYHYEGDKRDYAFCQSSHVCASGGNVLCDRQPDGRAVGGEYTI